MPARLSASLPVGATAMPAARSGRRRRPPTRPCAAHPGERSRRHDDGHDGGRPTLADELRLARGLGRGSGRAAARAPGGGTACGASPPRSTPARPSRTPHHPFPTPTSKPRFSGSVWCAPRRSNSPSTLPLPSSRYCSEPAQARRTVFHERAARAAAPPRPPPRREPDPSITLGGPPRGGGRILRSARTLPASAALAARARRRRVWAAGLCSRARCGSPHAKHAQSRAQPGTLVFWVREALPAGRSIFTVFPPLLGTVWSVTWSVSLGLVGALRGRRAGRGPWTGTHLDRPRLPRKNGQNPVSGCY